MNGEKKADELLAFNDEMKDIFLKLQYSSFAFAKHHSSSLLAVKASPSPEGRDLGRG